MRSQTFLRLSGPGDQPRMMPSTRGARVASARFSVPSLKSAGPISSGGDSGSMGCPSRSSFLPSRKASQLQDEGAQNGLPEVGLARVNAVTAACPKLIGAEKSVLGSLPGGGLVGHKALLDIPSTRWLLFLPMRLAMVFTTSSAQQL